MRNLNGLIRRRGRLRLGQRISSLRASVACREPTSQGAFVPATEWGERRSGGAGDLATSCLAAPVCRPAAFRPACFSGRLFFGRPGLCRRRRLLGCCRTRRRGGRHRLGFDRPQDFILFDVAVLHLALGKVLLELTVGDGLHPHAGKQVLPEPEQEQQHGDIPKQACARPGARCPIRASASCSSDPWAILWGADSRDP